MKQTNICRLSGDIKKCVVKEMLQSTEVNARELLQCCLLVLRRQQQTTTMMTTIIIMMSKTPTPTATGTISDIERPLGDEG